MTVYNQNKTLHIFFLLSVWIKGLAGLAETIGGVAVLFITQNAVDSFIIFLTAPELAEDPNDKIANYLSHVAHQLSTDTQLFVSAYLVIHGMIKLFLVAGMLWGKRWAYPTSIWFLGVFIVYQCYRFTHSHSQWLVILTIIDLSVVFLIWREYQWRQQSNTWQLQ